MDTKAKIIYREFCQNRAEIPVFSQPWYLDIVCNGEWEVILCKNKEGKIVTAWPHKVDSKMGVKLLQAPIYCPYQGPIYFSAKPYQSKYKHYTLQYSELRDLEELLPKYGYLRLKFYPDQKSWFPFFERGYEQTTRYTYIIRSGLSLDEIRKNQNPKLRNLLSKSSENNIEINAKDKIVRFVEMIKTTLIAKGAQKFFFREVLTEIIRSAISREQGFLYTIGDLESGVFTIEDSKTVYCLFTANTEKGRKINGVSHLIWYAILDTNGKGKDFDFEGSMLPGVEKFFRGFGGEQVPYHQITKINNPLINLYKFFRP